MQNYEDFIEKFKPKLTTDDCYTPPEVMEAVNGYVAKRWNLDPKRFVRPFYPGGDYKGFDYAEDAVVVDNPPFSIMAEIKDWYCEQGIRFFLFAPGLTPITGKHKAELAHIIVRCKIKYENGAVVYTSFVTNLPCNDFVEVCPGLSKSIDDVTPKKKKKKTVVLPPNAFTAAKLHKFASHDIPLAIRKNEVTGFGNKTFGNTVFVNEAGEEKLRHAMDEYNALQ